MYVVAGLETRLNFATPAVRDRARRFAGPSSTRSLLRRTSRPASDDPATHGGRWSWPWVSRPASGNGFLQWARVFRPGRQCQCATARLGGVGVSATPLLDRAGTRCDARLSAGRGNRAARASLKSRWPPVASRGFVMLIGAARTRLAKTPRLPSTWPWPASRRPLVRRAGFYPRLFRTWARVFRPGRQRRLIIRESIPNASRAFQSRRRARPDRRASKGGAGSHFGELWLDPPIARTR